MDATYNYANTTWVTNSGTGVLGATGKAVYIQGFLPAGSSSIGVAFYSGTTTVTMALCTFTGKSFVPFPMACPGGLTYQTLGTPGDADIRLLMFWIPGSTT